MMDGTVGQVISLFKNTEGRKPILLLGAGASFRSGIPLSNRAVNMIARASYARSIGQDWRNTQIPPTDFLRYLQEQKWYKPFSANPAEAFPSAVKELLTPEQFRRDFLKDMIKYHSISDGYVQLSKIIQRRLCNIVLTTNFDSLLIDSFRDQQPNFPEILEINRTAGEVRAFDPLKCLIVYLHGAVEYYTDCVLDEETSNLDIRLINKIRNEISYSPLIVIGYRGAEISIMEKLLLDSVDICEKFPHGIWWCYLGEDNLHSNVIKLETSIKPNFTRIKIDGFDELMKEINSSLANKFNVTFAERIDTVSEHSSNIFNFEINELDFLLIQTTLKDYCEKLKLDFEGDKLEEFLVQLGLLNKINSQYVSTMAGYLIFGKNPEEKIPYSNIQILNEETGESVLIKGNLLSQFNTIIEYLVPKKLILQYLLKRGKHQKSQNPILLKHCES
jgi:hypothetical protein